MKDKTYQQLSLELELQMQAIRQSGADDIEAAIVAYKQAKKIIKAMQNRLNEAVSRVEKEAAN